MQLLYITLLMTENNITYCASSICKATLILYHCITTPHFHSYYRITISVIKEHYIISILTVLFSNSTPSMKVPKIS